MPYRAGQMYISVSSVPSAYLPYEQKLNVLQEVRVLGSEEMMHAPHAVRVWGLQPMVCAKHEVRV